MDLLHFLFSHLSLSVLDSFINPDTFDLVSNLLSFTIIVVFFMSAVPERKEHKVLVTRFVMCRLRWELPEGIFPPTFKTEAYLWLSLLSVQSRSSSSGQDVLDLSW